MRMRRVTSHDPAGTRTSSSARSPGATRALFLLAMGIAWLVVPTRLDVGPDGLRLTRGAALAEDTRPSEIPYDTPGDFPLLDPGYNKQKHQVVIITDQDLQPKSVRLEEGQLVAWISYARAASAVVFEREVARSMICHSLVNFSIRDDELRSAEIHTGEFASFCELKPGRYRYKVVRKDPKAAGAGGARSRLDGWIVVGEAGEAK